MEEKKIITLDLTGCKYLGELHERIRVAFDFPEWYGANLSAFDDLLGTECDADEIIILGINTIPEELKEYVKMIIKILDKAVEERDYYSKLYSHCKPISYQVIDS